MYMANVWIIFILLQLMVRKTNGYWSDWSEWSICSQSCGGGVTTKVRQCLYRDGHHSQSPCKGKIIRYRTCNNEPCEKGAIGLRNLQCSSHNDETLYGRKLTWIPHYDPQAPCSLYCKANGTDIVHLFSPKVLDGTRCADSGLDMCVNGDCWPVGCDHVLNSTKVVDKCGKCGGDGDCRRRHRRFDWTSKGFGRCSASCGVGVRQTHFVCHNKRNRRVVSDKWCTRNRLPVPERQECFLKPCPPSTYDWRFGPWKDCTVSCGGGYSWRAVICIEMFANATQIEVATTLCGHPIPPNRRECNTVACPSWYAGEWSACSGTCGIGYQRREVKCQHVTDQFCDFSLAPLAYRNCSTNIPCPQSSDLQSSDLHERQNDKPAMDMGRRLDKSGRRSIVVSKNDIITDFIPSDGDESLKTQRFVVSEWSPCSATCENGSRWRDVQCKVYLPFLKTTIDLPDTDCQGEKPISTEICTSKPCYENYEYRSFGMTECSRSCLGGVQENIIKCVDKTTNKPVSNKNCVEAQTIPSERKVCNDVNCPQRWTVGDFGECSVSCGGGVMNRPVECIQEFADGHENILRLPDFMCSGEKPQTERRCNIIECPAGWGTGNWSKCSVSCGIGYRTRDVMCTKILATGRHINTTDYFCSEIPRPDSIEECKFPKCPTPAIKSTDAHFFQLNKLRKIKLKIGMNASLLPGTSLILHCPTKGVDKKTITWYKNGLPLPIGRRVKLSRKRSLKIKKSKVDVDNGLYMCKAGTLHASTYIRFLTVYDIFKATVFRENYLTQIPDSRLRSKGNYSVVHKDPVDRKFKQLHLVYSKWQHCSVSCGGGLQARNVTCEIITKDYFEEFPLKYCVKAGHSQPVVIRSCNIQSCAEWTTGEWNECDASVCVRRGVAKHRRQMHCLDSLTKTVVNESICIQTSDPPLIEKECQNENCTVVWGVSEWSECIGECGEKGFADRTLSCVWKSSGLPAGQLCENLPQPKARNTCQVPECKPECTDYSSYCSMAKLMNLCRYKSFKKKCCLTCGTETSTNSGA